MENDNKNLNALDGDAMLKEVLNEKIEAQRGAYKRSLKSAVVRNDHAQEAADKALDRARKTKRKLDALVEGGLEGFLTIPDKEEDGDLPIRTPKKAYSLSTRWNQND